MPAHEVENDARPNVMPRRPAPEHRGRGGQARSSGDRYHAFISYSRAVDRELAEALQLGLQVFAKPWYRRRAVRVFRDRACLPPNSALWPALRGALDASDHLIVLSSAESAASPWVQREVAHWICRHGVEGLLLVLTDPAEDGVDGLRDRATWDETGQDFDWERSPALCPALRGTFGEVPAYLDLGWARGQSTLCLDDDRFRWAVASLSAAVRGVPLDHLIGPDLSTHRRRLRRLRCAAALISALAALAAVAVRSPVISAPHRRS
jgi:hypothetical protein